LRSLRRPLPTFLIIGAQKSATRWLRVNLGLHPDVYTAPTELEFFNKPERFARGTRWYRRQFEGWAGEDIVGEATPGYMFWGERPHLVAERIHQVLRDVRLVAIVRNPVDRAQSAMVHHIKFSGLPKDTDLLRLVRDSRPEDDPLGIISGGWYAASLAPFQERFGSRLLVLVHDDLEHDPRGPYLRALGHVGASSEVVPEGLEQVMFSNQQDPSRAPIEPRTLSLDERRLLYEFFANDIDELERSLGRDLAMWRPDSAAR
jgi:hypothetical protein